MIRKLFKYLWIFALIAGLIGGGSWLLMRWKVMHESIPSDAMKVLGWARKFE